jgi:hypothetical protein
MHIQDESALYRMQIWITVHARELCLCHASPAGSVHMAGPEARACTFGIKCNLMARAMRGTPLVCIIRAAEKKEKW